MSAFGALARGSVGVVLIALTVNGASAAAAPSISWSAPQRIGPAPLAGSVDLDAISCPSIALCVAADGGSNTVFTSSDPASPSPRWTPATVGGSSSRLTELACPSSTLCVGAAATTIATSSNPAAGSSTWSVGAAPDAETDDLVALSCPSVHLCVAFDSAGRVLSSTDPGGGAGTWTAPGSLGAPRQVLALACPSVSVCFAVDTAGDLILSTDPAGGASSWSVVPALLPAEAMYRLSCPVAALCVAVTTGSRDDVQVVSTSSAQGAHVTSAAVGPAAGLSGVACASPTFCVATAPGGQVYRTADPAAGAGAWHPAGSVPDRPLGADAVACVSPALCAAVDGYGNVVSSTDPAATPTAWTTTQISGGRELIAACDIQLGCQPSVPNAITCPSAALCVALDAARYGDLAVSTDPARPGRPWRYVHLQVGHLSGVTCPSTRLCVAWGQDGLESSTRPAAGASAWAPSLTHRAPSIGAVACPARSLCFAIDNATKDVLVSRDPSAGARARWNVSATDIDNSNRESTAGFDTVPVLSVTDLSCPSAALCVAVDNYGQEITSTHPTEGRRAWKIADVDPWNQIEGMTMFNGVDCPSIKLCVAVDGWANIADSTRPTAGGSTWAIEQSGQQFSLSGVACASAAFCVYVGVPGVGNVDGGPANADALASAGPPSDGSMSGKLIDPDRVLIAVACAPTKLCVALDDRGAVIEGHYRSAR